MQNKFITGLVIATLLILLSGTRAGAIPDLCQRVDMKPVLSLQQINQAQFVHYLTVLSGQQGPPPEGLTPEQHFAAEVKTLVDAGFPPGLAEIEPGRLVTRQYFASMLYPVAVQSDPEFARQYGGLTDETQQLQALVKAEWIYAEEGRVYRDEVLSVLCNHPPIPVEQAAVIEITPVIITEANMEVPATEP